MSVQTQLVASFRSDEECAEAIELLHREHIRDFRAFSPIMSEPIMEASRAAHEASKSYVRFWVLFGGITGVLTAIAVTIGTSWEWNLNVGGRPIASIPPYIIIMFELMILIGGLSGVTGFFFHSRMPAFEPDPAYRTKFGADRFGLVLRCDDDQAAKLDSLLREAGAEEIVREAA
jgi:Alternative complex III, ActD subunit